MSNKDWVKTPELLKAEEETKQWHNGQDILLLESYCPALQSIIKAAGLEGEFPNIMSAEPM